MSHQLLARTVTSTMAMLAISSAQAAVSNIEAVTIYQGLASVERSLPVTVDNSAFNGEQTLVFSCLSPYLNPNSLSVQASDNINLGEISIETLSGEQASHCHNQSDESIKSQQRELALINAEYDAAITAKSYLLNLSHLNSVDAVQDVATTASSIETKSNDINARLVDITERQQQAQETLNQLMASNVDFVSDSVTQVSVRVATRQPGKLTLSYQVQGASWQPTYKAHLDTTTNALELIASAVVAQQTGENWTNIPLVLSSVNPNQRTSNVLPRVTRLSLYDPIEEGLNNVAPMAPRMQVSTPAPIAVMSTAEVSMDAPSPQAPLPSFNVSSSSINGITQYRLPQRISIPSDGRGVTTVIDTQQGTSNVWLRSTPSQETNAYWYASAPFLTPSWSNGTMQLYRDNTYVGQTTYAYQDLKEQGIGFGMAHNLIVRPLANESIEGDSGVINRTETLTTQKAYEFTNLYNSTMHLQVLGSEPVSQNDDITLTVSHIPPVSEQNWNDINGMVAWEFDLAPNQTQEVTSVFDIRYPARKELRSY